MKKLVTSMLVIAFVSVMSGAALAENAAPEKALYTQTSGGKIWHDLSWWGLSGAKPLPVKDATRSGYWWWPKEPVSNANDSELWGNRGKVFHNVYAPPADKKVAAAQPPAATPPATPARKFVVLNNVLFDFDKSVLKPEGKAEVDKLVAELKKYPKDTVQVVGHTCDLGSDAYNQALGQRRADAVQKYIVEQGIDKARVSTASKGETAPAVKNDSAANRKLNRRAEFVGTVVN
ncbi:MAG: OmpA family protein [Candidatus Hydrogenedentes bacterium]|nr:OmpA family protein [Candidatus Hydrogenedentota bacterium]